jgi:hypothetical protein
MAVVTGHSCFGRLEYTGGSGREKPMISKFQNTIHTNKDGVGIRRFSPLKRECSASESGASDEDPSTAVKSLMVIAAPLANPNRKMTIDPR